METGLLTTDQIRSWVIPLLEKYDMCSASLFGSYARDEADASSDIDILLVGNPGFRPLNVDVYKRQCWRRPENWLKRSGKNRNRGHG